MAAPLEPAFPDVPTTPIEEQTILHQTDVEQVIDRRLAALKDAGKLA